VNKLRKPGYLLKKNRQQMRCFLSEETLDDIGARLEVPPRKYFTRLSQENVCQRHPYGNHKIASFETLQIYSSQNSQERGCDKMYGIVTGSVKQ
jgi:hypothetical protein